MASKNSVGSAKHGDVVSVRQDATKKAEMHLLRSPGLSDVERVSEVAAIDDGLPAYWPFHLIPSTWQSRSCRAHRAHLGDARSH